MFLISVVVFYILFSFFDIFMYLKMIQKSSNCIIFKCGILLRNLLKRGRGAKRVKNAPLFAYGVQKFQKMHPTLLQGCTCISISYLCQIRLEILIQSLTYFFAPQVFLKALIYRHFVASFIRIQKYMPPRHCCFCLGGSVFAYFLKKYSCES